jgi:hypothetical protein
MADRVARRPRGGGVSVSLIKDGDFDQFFKGPLSSRAILVVHGPTRAFTIRCVETGDAIVYRTVRPEDEIPEGHEAYLASDRPVVVLDDGTNLINGLDPERTTWIPWGTVNPITIAVEGADVEVLG